MNTVLQGYDGHSEIQQIDTLRNPYYISSKTSQQLKFDIIATNMPFSQTITKKTIKNGKTITENHIAPLYYNGIAKNNGDAACVLHCLQNLKESGRMALVVPEGFLFRKDTSSVRQFLLSKAKLQLVISLPQSTFLPYTGVKTSILYFTDAHKPDKQKYY
ncbi:Type I restriction-modification system methyltransferase subunit [Rickettsia felis URRWXCal2]|nr:Type I restriction-modification system methyltransferase subunit [Rickettsia felis URRWXCal2]